MAARRLLFRRCAVRATGLAASALLAALSLTSEGQAWAASGSSAPAPTAAASCGDLAVGSSGDAVSTLQSWLGVAADGAFGPLTKAALVTWQHKHGVTPGGAVDAATWAAMPQKVSWQACGQAVTAVLPSGEKPHCAALAKGDVGPAVAVLQSGVGVAVDGGFGRQTRAAVIAVQQKHTLTADGQVTRSTWKAVGLTGTPACEPGPPPTATGPGGGTPPPPDAQKQARIRRRVSRIVASLTGPAASSSPITAAALGFAHDQLGKPYVYGAVGPDGYDCSGLAMAAYDAAALPMPRTAAQQYAAGPRLPLADAREGDLVYWGSDVADRATIYHTGIYVGNGQILDAPHTGTDVQVQPLWATDLMPKVVRPVDALTLPVKRGDSGPTVTDLQTALDHHGFSVTVDGTAGAATVAAVKQWQQTNEVKATGRVGPALWATLGWLPPKPAPSKH